MKLFDYSELIRVIENVEIREQKEKDEELIGLKKTYLNLENSIVNSGVLDDWNRLKSLCSKAEIRLCVSHQGRDSMGCILTHPEDFKYCEEYTDDGHFKIRMASGSGYTDSYGFYYNENGGIIWRVYHTSTFHIFDGFKEEFKRYETRIKLLETFINTYENYRDFQLKKIKEKFENRIKTEDIIKEKI